jgi:cyclase
MLKTRVLPIVLLTDYNVVKSIQFSTFRTLGNPITVCRVYDARAVGGGIRTLDQVRQLLRHGADKVAINTGAIESPRLISEIADEFGSQCVVASIDVKKDSEGIHRIYSHSGKKLTSLIPEYWAAQVQKLGAGEILLNSIDSDGAMKGYDIELIKMVTQAVRIPVVACGGAGKLQDFASAIIEGGANAVAAASVYHFTSLTPKDVKEYLRKKGVPVRL